MYPFWRIAARDFSGFSVAEGGARAHHRKIIHSAPNGPVDSHNTNPTEYYIACFPPTQKIQFLSHAGSETRGQRQQYGPSAPLLLPLTTCVSAWTTLRAAASPGFAL